MFSSPLAPYNRRWWDQTSSHEHSVSIASSARSRTSCMVRQSSKDPCRDWNPIWNLARSTGDSVSTKPKVSSLKYRGFRNSFTFLVAFHSMNATTPMKMPEHISVLLMLQINGECASNSDLFSSTHKFGVPAMPASLPYGVYPNRPYTDSTLISRSGRKTS